MREQTGGGIQQISQENLASNFTNTLIDIFGASEEQRTKDITATREGHFQVVIDRQIFINIRVLEFTPNPFTDNVELFQFGQFNIIKLDRT